MSETEHTGHSVHPTHSTELVLAANDAMRARRAPFAILWLWAFESVLASLIAWPFVTVAGDAYRSHPEGDAVLWRPGALALTDLAAAWQHGLGALAPLPILVLGASVALGLLPVALLVGQIAYATRARQAAPFAQLMPRALVAFGPLMALLGLTMVVEGVILGVGIAAGGATGDAFDARLGEARAEQLGWLVTLLFALLASMVGVAQDLARVAVVRFQVGALRSVRLAFNTLRRSPILLYWSWAWRAGAMALLVVLGSVMADRSSAKSGTLPLLFVVHQAIVLGRIALRASWLAKGLRAVDLAHRVVRRSAPG